MLKFWILFNLFALGLLALDLRVFHRRGRIMRSREAPAWSVFWIALAALFAAIIFFWHGRQIALEFVTGYVLELSLSVDNLFLFLVIFRYFSVPEKYQHNVLFWGILGAMLMRGVLILAGVGLIQRFHWILYILGAVLIISGIRLAFLGAHQVNLTNNFAVRLLRHWIPVTDDYQNGDFFVRGWKTNRESYGGDAKRIQENRIQEKRSQGTEGSGILYATPLLIVLVVVETTDLLFAVDSIPAVLAVTLNAFIAYTSNVFAILGLRSMYFAVSGLMRRFRFLHTGLAIVLIIIGAKMIAADYFPVSTLLILAAVGLVIGVSIAASVVLPAKLE
ncbi:MAG: TerC/Alx family metal homeostasis membrane protein [Candidatus Sulfotelmatobacter sp.]